MGFARKGFRKIIIQEEVFLWKLNSKVAMAQEFGYSPIYIAIQKANSNGSKLIANTNMEPKWNYAAGNPNSEFRGITPKDVRKIIIKALNEGWQPNEKGKPFEVDFNLEYEDKN